MMLYGQNAIEEHWSYPVLFAAKGGKDKHFSKILENWPVFI